MVDCKRVYECNFGQALNFAGKVMLDTGYQLIKMVTEPDAGLASFAASTLAKSCGLFLPHYGMILKIAENAKDGFISPPEVCT